MSSPSWCLVQQLFFIQVFSMAGTFEKLFYFHTTWSSQILNIWHKCQQCGIVNAKIVVGKCHTNLSEYGFVDAANVSNKNRVDVASNECVLQQQEFRFVKYKHVNIQLTIPPLPEYKQEYSTYLLLLAMRWTFSCNFLCYERDWHIANDLFHHSNGGWKKRNVKNWKIESFYDLLTFFDSSKLNWAKRYFNHKNIIVVVCNLFTRKYWRQKR